LIHSRTAAALVRDHSVHERESRWKGVGNYEQEDQKTRFGGTCIVPHLPLRNISWIEVHNHTRSAFAHRFGPPLPSYFFGRRCPYSALHGHLRLPPFEGRQDLPPFTVGAQSLGPPPHGVHPPGSADSSRHRSLDNDRTVPLKCVCRGGGRRR
jgi:hypothetical protein